MTDDIAPELLEKLKNDFDRRYSDSKSIQKLLDKINNGSDYLTANDYAIDVGDLLASVFKDNISSSILPEGKLYYNIATRTIEPMMRNNYNLISEVCGKIQKNLNSEAGIGINAIIPTLNEDRIDGLIGIVSGVSNYDEIKYVLDESIPNFSQSIVDESIGCNASFQSKSGLSPKITRTVTGKCCKWCLNLAGTYDYDDVSDTGNDVFRRHSKCRCLVTYHPISGKVQNSHSKKSLNKQELSEQDYRKQLGIKEKNIQIENNRKVMGLKVNDVRINGLSNHLDYRMMNREVSISEVIDAIKNPLKFGEIKYDEYGKPSFKIVGKSVTIYLDPDNGIITTTHKTGSKLADKLLGKEK